MTRLNLSRLGMSLLLRRAADPNRGSFWLAASVVLYANAVNHLYKLGP
jgi:hypothetical protein